MNKGNVKHELTNLITVIFQNTGLDTDVIEEVDFVEDLGMDSITFISMVVEIESYFDIIIPDGYLRIDKFNNVDQIVSIIEEELKKEVEED